jgi:hypothetical protein
VTMVLEPSSLSLIAFGTVALLAAGYHKRVKARPAVA